MTLPGYECSECGRAVPKAIHCAYILYDTGERCSQPPVTWNVTTLLDHTHIHVPACAGCRRPGAIREKEDGDDECRGSASAEGITKEVSYVQTINCRLPLRFTYQSVYLER